MNGMQIDSRKNLMLFTGRAFPELAAEVGARPRRRAASRPAPTSSPTARSSSASRSRCAARDAFVVQSITTPVNTWLMETLLMVDALKRASAKRITVVMPFYPYARQDKKHRGREPISARLVADMFKTAGADRLMTVDLHTAQIQGFFDGPVDHLFALPLLADHVEKHWGDQRPRRRLAGRRPRPRRRALDRPPRLRPGDHPQAPRPERPQRGQGRRGRR